MNKWETTHFLPDNDVLVYTENGFIFIAFCDLDDEIWYDRDTGEPIGIVTHWMPLPNIPDENS